MASLSSKSLFAKRVKQRELHAAASAEQEKRSPLSQAELQNLFAYDLKTADAHLSKLKLLNKDNRFKPV
ncbi:hypothetical protein N8760_03860 [Rhodobacteraceae bacterium]|nr:hypothetical protein [Paracoccaceae bacterium]